MVATRKAIVGRDTELAAIDDFLAGERGERRVLLLEGEAGIGKTTIWLEAVAAAERRGRQVLRAQPAESELKLSYAALADLVATAYDEVDHELPEPQRRALETALLRSSGATNARALGTAVTSLVAALAAREQVVVAIDDAQWLDPASARALEFAARRLPADVRLLLARRPSLDAPLGLAQDAFARIDVGPLSLAALHDLLGARLGATPTRPLLVRIAETSGGNPFFALEIGRFVGDAHEPGRPLPVPPSLHELVAGRLDALSPRARDAALVASALSRPTVAAVGARPDTLAEAEAAGVLVVERERIRFSHPLLASAVYDAAGGAQRLELHRRLAGLVTDPEERALHLALGATATDENTAAELEQAAVHAALRGAHDAAADLYQAAQRLTPDAGAEARARRLGGEASSLHAVGSADARTIAERAVAAAPPGPSRAEALFQLSQIAWVHAGELGPLDCLRRALDDAGDDRQLRGRIHAKLGMYSDGDQRRAVEHLEAAAELLDERADPGLLAYTLLGVLFFGTQTGRAVDDGLLERALELERRAGRDSEKSSLVLIWLQCTDAHAAARERHRLEDEWYRDRGEEVWRAEKRAHLARVEFEAGSWELARSLLDRSCAELEPVGSDGPLGMPFWTRALVDAHGGSTERARAALLPLLEAARGRPGSAWFATFHLEALGFTALTEGDHAAADRAFAEAEELLESIGVRVPLAVRTDADHVEAVVALGELERARRLLARFEWRAARAPRPWTRQALPRAQALVAGAEGDPAAALALLEQAPVLEHLPFGHARNLLVRGTLERRLKRRRAAAVSLAGAVEIFERLGAPDWVRRARDELGRVGLRRRDPSALTATEHRVAELAASGLTNREVARAAYVSPKTVEANLARVYRKLEIRSRAELGAAMAASKRREPPDSARELTL